LDQIDCFRFEARRVIWPKIMGNSNPKPAIWTENVLHLTASTIQKIANEQRSLLILFFDPKCAVSSAELLKFREAAKALKQAKVRNNFQSTFSIVSSYFVLDIRSSERRGRHRRGRTHPAA
jgi:hypothetical protein